MYPHERSLVKRLADKPFVLLGINSDPKPNLLAAIKRESITWRSWSDGATDGPISSVWNVDSWPTTYVIDQAGIIRFKDLSPEQLDQAIDNLLAHPPGKSD